MSGCTRMRGPSSPPSPFKHARTRSAITSFWAPVSMPPGTAAGRVLLAHELAHVVQQSSGTAGMVAAQGAMLLQRAPTYGNLPRDAPALGSSGDVIRLRNVNGTWKEVGGRYGRTARGNYDFVVKDGEIFAVKSKRTMGALGHTEAARGERVSWAGQVEFEGGKVKSWNDGSGHYRSLSSMREPAVQAGLPNEKFIQHPETAPRPRPKASMPQLPVEQPATKPRVPGEQPKVGSGPHPGWRNSSSAMARRRRLRPQPPLRRSQRKRARFSRSRDEPPARLARSGRRQAGSPIS